MRDGRGGTRLRPASSGGLPGPTHRTAPVSCSPPGNKGASLTRSGCRVGPAGTVTAVAAQHPSPAPVCPLGAHLLLFSPMGSDCDCPPPALGGDVTCLPGHPDLLPRAGPGLAPLLGHPESGAAAPVTPLPGARSRSWRAGQGPVRGVPPRPPGRAVPQLTPGTFSVTCTQRAPSPGTSLLPRSQESCLTAPRQPSC